jgi:hypothetical protein
MNPADIIAAVCGLILVGINVFAALQRRHNNKLTEKQTRQREKDKES